MIFSLLDANIVFTFQSEILRFQNRSDIVVYAVNVNVAHDHFDPLDNSLAGSSILCLKCSGPADQKKRTGSNWRKVMPLYSFCMRMVHGSHYKVRSTCLVICLSWTSIHWESGLPCT